MRGLDPFEAYVLRGGPTGHLNYREGDADEAALDAAYGALVARGCMTSSGWEDNPEDPELESMHYECTDLGLLALRVSIQGAPVPIG